MSKAFAKAFANTPPNTASDGFADGFSDGFSGVVREEMDRRRAEGRVPAAMATYALINYIRTRTSSRRIDLLHFGEAVNRLARFHQLDPDEVDKFTWFADSLGAAFMGRMDVCHRQKRSGRNGGNAPGRSGSPVCDPEDPDSLCHGCVLMNEARNRHMDTADFVADIAEVTVAFTGELEALDASPPGLARSSDQGASSSDHA